MLFETNQSIDRPARINGTSIVDVTDPTHPPYLRHIPGREGTYRSGRCADDASAWGSPKVIRARYIYSALWWLAHEIGTLPITDQKLIVTWKA
jgi:hypothetical protein